jgi:choline kinase
MVHSLFCAEKELSGDVLVAYADILYDIESLSRVVNASANHIAVAVDMKWEDYYRARYGDPFSEAESLVFEKDLRIRDIGEASPPRDRIQAQYIGLIRLDNEGCKTFRAYYRQFAGQFTNKEWLRKRPFEKAHMTDFLQGLINEGVRVQAVPIEGGWLEFDSPSDYQKVQAWQASGTLEQFCRLD